MLSKCPIIFVCLALLLLGCDGNESMEQRDTDSTSVQATAIEEPLFTRKIAEQTGVYFINELQEDRYRNILMYQYYYNGGGVALGDVNKDGLTDIFFTANNGSNKLYLNRGQWQFEDVTYSAGLLIEGNSWCTGATMVDINHDGWLDIYVSRSGNLQPKNRRNLLYINNRNGTFTENAGFYGLDDPGYSVQAAFFDYDRDGDLDMYLLNHGMEYYGTALPKSKNQRDPFVGDKLYRREADKTYTDVSKEAGILGFSRSYGLGLGIGDLNRDGWDDIYVANDFYEHDYLYLNQQDGSFQEVIKAVSGHTSFFGMGVDIADFNNDALPDVAVVDMTAEDHRRQKENLAGISRAKFREFVDQGYHYQYMYNSLQLNAGMRPDGKPHFSNVARLAGMDKTDWSWAPLFADFDQDGLQDLLITNGLRKDVLNLDFINNMNTSLQAANTNFTELPEAEVQQILGSMPAEPVSNYIFQNQGGISFLPRSRAWGLDEPSFSNGAAYGDLDNDGDLDLVINNLDQPAMLYENRARQQQRGHFLKIRLEGPSRNPLGLGAEVYLYQNGELQYRQLYNSRGYQSSVEPVLHFGLGNRLRVDSLKITWPDGKQSHYPSFEGDRLVTARYENALAAEDEQEVEQPWLQEVADEAAPTYRHLENEYDDFDRQFLLPFQLSREGPALAVGDVNRDGLDDFYAGGAAGQAGSLWLQRPAGSFSQQPGPWQQYAESEEVEALFFDLNGDDLPDLYVGCGGAEFEADDKRLQDRMYLNDGQGNFSEEPLPIAHRNTASLAATDFDRDGDTDLFVGGGAEPGNFPLSHPSALLENRNGRLLDVTDDKAPALASAGMVKAAAWLDDENPRLMLAPFAEEPQLYVFSGGQLVKERFPITPEKEGRFSGFWFSIHPLDIDDDGDLDVLLGNLGKNYPYRPAPRAPLQLSAVDMDRNSTLELFLAYRQNGKSYPVRDRDEIYEQWRGIKKAFPDYASYARATLPDILGEQEQQALSFRIATLAHMLLIREDDGSFSPQELPDEAQVSVLRDALWEDFNGDQDEELLVVGNHFGMETGTPRMDASHGLVMRRQNDRLIPVSMEESGLFVPGDTRKAALLQSAGSKRLLILENNGSAKFYVLPPSEAFLSKK